MSFNRKLSLLLAVFVALNLVLAACTSTTPAPTKEEPPTVPVQVEPTAVPVEPTAEPVSGPVRGDILRHATEPPGNLDPAFLNSVGDDEIGRQWHDFLVFVDPDNLPDPERSLAESWESNDIGTVWTFHIRQGVQFHNGRPLTAADILFTFNRLRDPDVGSATVALYSNVKDIEAVDDYTVRFTLETSNPDFLLDLGDYHALVMDSETKDFQTEFNGTGPWMIDQYSPEDRIVFKANPNYWMMGEDGKPLPYAAGMEWLFLAEPSAQVEALRGGQVDWIIYVPPEFIKPLQEDPNVQVQERASNAHYVIHMRSDRPPADDERVRKAIKLATDRQAIADIVAPGFSIVGHDTPIGPLYGDFYLEMPPMERNVEEAKALLAEAGYPNGLEIDLSVMDALAARGIATVWKEQLAEAGITVNIQMMPVDVYYGADDVWLECDFGITDWGSRPYPQTYLLLAYTCDAPWNESHFCDEELDRLALAAGSELDHETRVGLYHQIQEILADRGGVILPYFEPIVMANRSNVRNMAPGSMSAGIDLRRVYIQPE